MSRADGAVEQSLQNLSSRPHGCGAGDALNADMGLGVELQVFWFECKPRDGSSTGPAVLSVAACFLLMDLNL